MHLVEILDAPSPVSMRLLVRDVATSQKRGVKRPLLPMDILLRDRCQTPVSRLLEDMKLASIVHQLCPLVHSRAMRQFDSCRTVGIV